MPFCCIPPFRVARREEALFGPNGSSPTIQLSVFDMTEDGYPWTLHPHGSIEELITGLRKDFEEVATTEGFRIRFRKTITLPTGQTGPFQTQAQVRLGQSSELNGRSGLIHPGVCPSGEAECNLDNTCQAMFLPLLVFGDASISEDVSAAAEGGGWRLGSFVPDSISWHTQAEDDVPTASRSHGTCPGLTALVSRDTWGRGHYHCKSRPDAQLSIGTAKFRVTSAAEDTLNVAVEVSISVGFDFDLLEDAKALAVPDEPQRRMPVMGGARQFR